MLAHALWVRQVLQALALASGRERLPPQATAWPDFFDNRVGIGPVQRKLFYEHEPTGVMLPFKGRPQPIPIEQKIGIEAHQMAIRFGTSSKARAFWHGLIADGTIPEEIWMRFGIIPSAAAERMALHARFWEVPYHWIGLLNGDVLHNNDVTRHTYHGDGGNRLLVGCALEGNFPGLESQRTKKHHGFTEHVIETGRAALTLCTTDSREKGAEIEWLYAHRQYDDGRLGDPGEGWWREIGLPVCAKVGLKRNVEFRHGSGTPICLDWDPEGIVDYRGRPLR